jgi:GH15 family glucan-1,4-alpha-glucosidase
MDDYPLIASHGMIGDLQTAALVSTDGAIDWFCAPRFDSPSLFGALLDRQDGGYCRVRPEHGSFSSRQLYFPDTAVLITRFLTEQGVGELVDFMPVAGPVATERHRIVRLLRCVRGRIRFQVDVAPRFDYGRRAHVLEVTEDGAQFLAGDLGLTVHAVREPGDDRLAVRRAGDGRDLRLEIELTDGQVRGLVLETGTEPPRQVSRFRIQQLFEETARFWQTWLGGVSYAGRWREAIQRSAITLKLLTYAPTGAPVAALTAGLPEQLGGERNWDYRFTWVRDASFSVGALLRLGLTEEASAFIGWLRERLEAAPGPGGPLRVMYRVDGSNDLLEEELPHWEGYRASRPVRVGNDASGQLQLDIYGEAMDSLWLADRQGLRFGQAGWAALVETLQWLAEHWDSPDEGIWETRGGRRDFTYGRLMSWVAFDRALRLAESNPYPAPVAGWRAQRDAIYQQIQQRGWDPQRGAFVQQYGAAVLDSALLRMPGLGFVAPGDPRWTSTLRAIEADLVTDSLVYRYDPQAAPDGLAGDEGTFSLCTFGYVEALARSGRAQQARLTFDKMLTYANHLGLYAEEIAPTGEQLGNFPQAFTHLALIEAALVLDAVLDGREAATPGRGPG